MDYRANNVNVYDWIEASKEMKILAYVESVRFELPKTLNEEATRIFSGDESRTAYSYADNTFYNEILDAERDIQSLTSGLYSGEPLDRSEEIHTLAEEAVEYSRTHQNDDVDQWARRLADDVSKNIDS